MKIDYLGKLFEGIGDFIGQALGVVVGELVAGLFNGF
jgi:hypothetical protein